MLSRSLEAERQALLRVLDGSESACPDCLSTGVLVTYRADVRRWHIGVRHSSCCAVKRSARAKRAYRRWLVDQLAATGARVAHYEHVRSELVLSHR